MNKNIYIAAADNLSKTKAYEYADEFGFEIVGESGYVDDASDEICTGNVNTVICSQRLFDGDARQLYHKLPQHIKDVCCFCIISPVTNGSYKLKRLSHNQLHQNYSVIDTALNYVEIPKSIKGYTLFKEALEIALSTPDALLDISHKIYAPIAKAHNTDINNIEYNMRTAKKHSLLHCNPDIISEVFGDFADDKSLTLSIYLSKLSDYILKSR